MSTGFIPTDSVDVASFSSIFASVNSNYELTASQHPVTATASLPSTSISSSLPSDLDSSTTNTISGSLDNESSSSAPTSTSTGVPSSLPSFTAVTTSSRAKIPPVAIAIPVVLIVIMIAASTLYFCYFRQTRHNRKPETTTSGTSQAADPMQIPPNKAELSASTTLQTPSTISLGALRSKPELLTDANRHELEAHEANL